MKLILKENNEIINYKKDERGYIEIIKMNSCFASTKNTTIERCIVLYSFCAFLEKVSKIVTVQNAAGLRCCFPILLHAEAVTVPRRRWLSTN